MSAADRLKWSVAERVAPLGRGQVASGDSAGELDSRLREGSQRYTFPARVAMEMLPSLANPAAEDTSPAGKLTCAIAVPLLASHSCRPDPMLATNREPSGDHADRGDPLARP